MELSQVEYNVFLIIMAIFIRCDTREVLSNTFEDKEVRTNKGILRGKIVEFPKDSSLKSAHRYFGISYALGSFRYMPPSEIVIYLKQEGKGIMSVSCPQKNIRDEMINGSSIPKRTRISLWRIIEFTERKNESCLYLNVYVPNNGKLQLRFNDFTFL